MPHSMHSTSKALIIFRYAIRTIVSGLPYVQRLHNNDMACIQTCANTHTLLYYRLCKPPEQFNTPIIYWFSDKICVFENILCWTQQSSPVQQPKPMLPSTTKKPHPQKTERNDWLAAERSRNVFWCNPRWWKNWKACWRWSAIVLPDQTRRYVICGMWYLEIYMYNIWSNWYCDLGNSHKKPTL